MARPVGCWYTYFKYVSGNVGILSDTTLETVLYVRFGRDILVRSIVQLKLMIKRTCNSLIVVSKPSISTANLDNKANAQFGGQRFLIKQ